MVFTRLRVYVQCLIAVVTVKALLAPLRSLLRPPLQHNTISPPHPLPTELRRTIISIIIIIISVHGRGARQAIRKATHHSAGWADYRANNIFPR